MKKFFNKSICISILMIIIFSYIFPIILAANTKTYNSYVALGDSISYGYGLANRDEEGFAQKVRVKYNIQKSDFNNLAVSGMTCAEFLQYIKQDKITQVIENSELLTVSIGSNELLGLVTEAVCEVTGITVKEGENLAEKVKEELNKKSTLQQLAILRQFYDTITSEEMKVKIEAAIASYEDNWSKSVEYIKTINSDIFIVALEFYNPYYELEVLSYDFGGFVDENIQKLNEILWNISNSEQEYKIAKIYDAFNTTNPRLTNVSTSISEFNVDPHPNALGHEVISTKILDELTTTTTNKKDIASLTISNIPDQIYTGKTITPVITIKDNDTQLVENIDYTIAYSENIEIGEAKVTIIGIGNYEGKVIKTFNIKEEEQKDIQTLKINPINDQTYTGIKIIPDVEIYDDTTKLVKNTDYKLDYKNNINVGKAQIIISGIGNYTGNVGKEFNIIQKNIEQTTIVDILEQEYTGEEITPDIEILDGSAKLLENIDYTINYENNIEKGEATVKITGKGNYTGAVTKKFNIIENNQIEKIDISKLNITEINDKIYTGKLITPEVRITDGEKVLIKNIDYLINYINNIEIGTGSAIITGIGDYAGKIEINFKILRKNIINTTIEDISDQSYTGKENEPELVITSDHIKLEEGKDYTKEYINNIEEGTASIKITGIGNYEGTTIKTFNIIKEKEENIVEPEINDNEKTEVDNNIKVEQDDTTYDKNIPHAGISTLIVLFIIITIITSLILFRKCSKYKDL